MILYEYQYRDEDDFPFPQLVNRDVGVSCGTNIAFKAIYNVWSEDEQLEAFRYCEAMEKQYIIITSHNQPICKKLRLCMKMNKITIQKDYEQ